MVWIDDHNKAYGRMRMCHMIATTTYELIKMAKRIGVHPRHIQHQGTAKEHFDVSKGAKLRAIKFGAKAISRRALTSMIAERKKAIKTYPFIINKRKAVKIKASSYEMALNKVLALYPGQKVTTTHARNMEKYLTRINDKERCLTTVLDNGVRGGSLVTDEDIIEDILPHITTKLKHKLFMNLEAARKKAIQQSRDKKSVVYVNVVEAGQPNEGDCNLEDTWDHTTYAAFKNGSEIAVPVKPTKEEKSVKGKPKEWKTTGGEDQMGKKKTVKETAVESASNNKQSKTMATIKQPTKKVAAKKAAPAKKEAAAPAKAPKGKKNVTIKEIIKLIKGGTTVYNHADKSLTLNYMEKMKDHSRVMPVSY